MVRATDYRTCAAVNPNREAIVPASSGSKWYSQISIAGQPLHLGSFADPADAAKAYDRAIWSKLGTEALTMLNFPDEVPEAAPYLKQLRETRAAEAAAQGAPPPGTRSTRLLASRVPPGAFAARFRE